MDPPTFPKTYWSVLKSSHNNSTKFLEKAKLFNFFFAKKCSIIGNDSEILSYIPKPKNLYQLSRLLNRYRKDYTKFRFK